MSIRCIVILLLCSVLSACGSMRSSNDPDTLKNNKIASINTQLGLAYLGRGDVERAKQKLLYALDKAPQLPEAWYSMAYFQEKTGNKAEAQQDYLKALRLAPNRGDVLNNYGTFLCRSGDYQQAIQYFLAAAKDKHYLDVAGAYENAGLCALKIPDRSEALHYFSQALEEDPSRQVSIAELNKLKY